MKETKINADFINKTFNNNNKIHLFSFIKRVKINLL